MRGLYLLGVQARHLLRRLQAFDWQGGRFRVPRSPRRINQPFFFGNRMKIIKSREDPLRTKLQLLSSPIVLWSENVDVLLDWMICCGRHWNYGLENLCQRLQSHQ